MLQRRDQNDEGAHDAAAGATHYWMRFFASLRMTERRKSRRLRDNTKQGVTTRLDCFSLST
jgi:hypothetical protein